MKNFKRIIIGMIFLCLIVQPSQAKFKTTKIFHLSDGTTVKGSITGIRKRDGAYIIESSKLGTVAIHPDDILNMNNGNAAAFKTPPLQPTTQKQSAISGPSPIILSPESMKQAQTMLLSDPKIMQSTQDLLQDPEIVQMLQDPQLMQTISSMDPTAIQSDPKIQKLLQNPIMQQILRQASQKLNNKNNNLSTP